MASTAVLHPQLTQQELQERRDHVDSVLGTTLAEGVSPEPAVLALFERYAQGEMSQTEMSSAIRARYGI